MNEEVEKTIANSLDGFQWILFGIVVILILYLILNNLRKKN